MSGIPEVNISVAMPPDDDHVTIIYRRPYLDTAQVFAYVVARVDALDQIKEYLEDAQRRGYNPFQVDGPKPLPKGVTDITERRKK